MTAIDRILKTFENLSLDSFPLEDVFFTGILRAKADLSSPKDQTGICEHLGELWVWIKSLKFLSLQNCFSILNFLFDSHLSAQEVRNFELLNLIFIRIQKGIC